MNAAIIPFDFEEQAVRVMLRDGEPWFVAADVCRVLELGNVGQALSRLDDDERDNIISNDVIGRSREMAAISESGLYALVLGSRKEQAKRFRKWITAEVLPAIRRTGRYEHPGLPEAEAPEVLVGGGTFREAELWLAMVREARMLAGTRAGMAMWARSPLPPLMPAAQIADPAEGMACLRHLLAHAIDGQTLTEWIEAALAGNTAAEAVLTGAGLRAKAEALFVASAAHPGIAGVFAGTRWLNNEHRRALAVLTGVVPAPVPYTLGGLCVRGVMVPYRHIVAETTGGSHE